MYPLSFIASFYVAPLYDLDEIHTISYESNSYFHHSLHIVAGKEGALHQEISNHYVATAIQIDGMWLRVMNIL